MVGIPQSPTAYIMVTNDDSASTFSASFCDLFASSFFEALRRQQRHQKISVKFSSATDSTWQLSLSERLFGLSGLGIFRFDFFATSMGDELLFVDDAHPMVTHGRIPSPGPDAAINRLRAQFPDTPELQAHGLEGDDTFFHGVCGIAAVHTDALFYYRGPTNAQTNSAVWILVQHAIANPTTALTSIPDNLASLTPPRADFGSYDAVVAAYEAHRPTGGAARLNEFRISLTGTLGAPFPEGVSFKALFLGFLAANGFAAETTQRTDDQAGGSLEEVAALVDGAPGLTATFDSLGRLINIDMMITSAGYADDGYGL